MSAAAAEAQYEESLPMMKVLLWGVIIIFVIGLLVLTGLLKLIF